MLFGVKVISLENSPNTERLLDIVFVLFRISIPSEIEIDGLPPPWCKFLLGYLSTSE